MTDLTALRPAGVKAPTWEQITIEHIEHGQPRAYADSRYTYHVTVTGGTRSTRPGFDLPYGTGGSDHRILERATGLAMFIHPWKQTRESRKGGGMDVHFQSYLDQLHVVQTEPGRFVFDFTVILAYTD